MTYRSKRSIYILQSNVESEFLPKSSQRHNKLIYNFVLISFLHPGILSVHERLRLRSVRDADGGQDDPLIFPHSGHSRKHRKLLGGILSGRREPEQSISQARRRDPHRHAQ